MRPGSASTIPGLPPPFRARPRSSFAPIGQISIEQTGPTASLVFVVPPANPPGFSWSAFWSGIVVGIVGGAVASLLVVILTNGVQWFTEHGNATIEDVNVQPTHPATVMIRVFGYGNIPKPDCTAVVVFDVLHAPDPDNKAHSDFTYTSPLFDIEPGQTLNFQLQPTGPPLPAGQPKIEHATAKCGALHRTPLCPMPTNTVATTTATTVPASSTTTLPCPLFATTTTTVEREVEPPEQEPPEQERPETPSTTNWAG